jgi:hypothetical protein
VAVNQEELAICRHRGHDFRAVNGPMWRRCKWCGTWVRTVTTVEEREDDPPEDEQDPGHVLTQKIDEIRAARLDRPEQEEPADRR